MDVRPVEECLDFGTFAVAPDQRRQRLRNNEYLTIACSCAQGWGTPSYAWTSLRWMMPLPPTDVKWRPRCSIILTGVRDDEGSRPFRYSWLQSGARDCPPRHRRTRSVR